MTGGASGFDDRFAVAQLLRDAGGSDDHFTGRFQAFGDGFFLRGRRCGGFFGADGQLGQHDDDNDGYNKCQYNDDSQLLWRFDQRGVFRLVVFAHCDVPELLFWKVRIISALPWPVKRSSRVAW